MKTIERVRPRQAHARMAIAVAYFAGITLIVGWSLSRGAAADRPAEPPEAPQQSGTLSDSPETAKAEIAGGKVADPLPSNRSSMPSPP